MLSSALDPQNWLMFLMFVFVQTGLPCNLRPEIECKSNKPEKCLPETGNI